MVEWKVARLAEMMAEKAAEMMAAAMAAMKVELKAAMKAVYLVARMDDYVVVKTAVWKETLKAEQLVAVKVVLLAVESDLKRVERKALKTVEKLAEMWAVLMVTSKAFEMVE